MQTLVVGDIHGCLREFKALREKAGLSDGDRVIAVGDIVDRGPETPQACHYFQTMPNTDCVMGNHERKHVRGWKNETKLAVSQIISREQFGADYGNVVDWMGRLPHFLEIPEAIILHAFLEPDVPLDQQDPRIICGSLSGEHILRQRYRQPWYEMCDRDKPVIVGHRNYLGTDCPFIYKDKVIGLDTDCVRGKTLTGILLPSFQIFSVRSRGDLWSQVRQQFPHIGRKAPAEPSVSEPSAWSDEDQSVLESLIAALKLECHETWERIQVSAGPAGSANALKIFSREVGKGLRSHLLHLARLDRLNSEAARQAIGSPETMRSLFR